MNKKQTMSVFSFILPSILFGRERGEMGLIISNISYLCTQIIQQGWATVLSGVSHLCRNPLKNWLDKSLEPEHRPAAPAELCNP